VFFHICPFFEDRPYFGLTMFFRICPACLPAGELQKTKEFHRSLLPIVFPEYKFDTNNKNKEKKTNYCNDM